MNKTLVLLIIISAILLAILIIRIMSNAAKANSNQQLMPNSSQKPTKNIDNDKIIIVRNLKLDYMKQALQQFCDSYNAQGFVALPRLTILENDLAITFPYDIDFEHFCYLVNYIKYANNLCLQPDYKPDIKAWCSTKQGDAWMNSEIINKMVLIYIPEWDKEYDNVYLITQDNIGFKMGFALGRAHKKLDKPVLEYYKCPEDIQQLANKQKIDFE
jgi:hypothetical protein